MPLLADGIRLGQPGGHLAVDVPGPVQPEAVHHVVWRVDLGPAQPRAVEPAGQDDVPVQPAPPRHERGEAHANLERDPRRLGQDDDRPQRPDHLDHPIERRPHLRVLPMKCPIEVVRLPAGVRLVAVREPPPAGRQVQSGTLLILETE
ncbi:MAG TPA: hypothetical protein VOB72_20225 [Candidatus Dormibacteraeota bacterium]|nr:hypothetical protein [Candidatus Dormibacteraeota bacterium]